MIITKKSIFTGNFNSMELNITQEQLDCWNKGDLIQNVFPNLNADEREFLLNGVTPEEWNKVMGEEE